MTENKYELAFYEWVRLGDQLMDPDVGDDALRLLKVYQETAKKFEIAFEKAEKWDKIVKAFPESRLRMLLDILESDLQSSVTKAKGEKQ